MLFNLAVGLAAAAFGVGISRFLPGWLGADTALQANASAYFAIWSASLPFIMAMGTYAAMLRSTGDALTPGLISIFTCVLDIIFNFFLINPTREMTVFGPEPHGLGSGLGRTGRSTGHGACQRCGRYAGVGRSAAAGRPAVHPQARLLAHYPRLSAQRVEGRRTAGSRARRPVLGTGAAGAHRVRLGTTAIAANSLGVSAESLCYMAGYGIQDAALALVGQAVGANRRDMAKRFAWLCTAMGMGIMALTGVGLYVFAPHLMGIFTADAAVIALGAPGAAYRSLCRADVRGKHRSQRLYAGARATAPAALS